MAIANKTDMTDHARAERALLHILERVRGAKVPGCFVLVPELVERAVEEVIAERDELRSAAEEHRNSALVASTHEWSGD
jgi:hypothetical protein